MTFDQVMQDLKNRSFKPIYFFFGDEPYYIDLLTDYITKNVLSEAEQSFNQTIVYGKDSDVGQVINLAKRFPMMASHQVVVLKEAQELKDFSELIHYVEHPLASTLLVLNYKYKNPDSRKKIFKSLKSAGVYYQSKKLYDNQVPGWITSYASSRKYRIEPKAAALLTEFLGSDLSKIVNEIDKLFIAMGTSDRNITPAAVERNIGISKDYNQFELQNALGKKDVVKANRIIRHFAENEKNNPLPLTIGFLNGFFSKLLMLHYSKDRSRENLAKVLKVNPFFVKDYQQAAQRYSAGRVVEIISLLRTYDMRSKGWEGNNQSGGELLKELIFKIIHL